MDESEIREGTTEDLAAVLLAPYRPMWLPADEVAADLQASLDAAKAHLTEVLRKLLGDSGCV